MRLEKLINKIFTAKLPKWVRDAAEEQNHMWQDDRVNFLFQGEVGKYDGFGGGYISMKIRQTKYLAKNPEGKTKVTVVMYDNNGKPESKTIEYHGRAFFRDLFNRRELYFNFK